MKKLLVAAVLLAAPANAQDTNTYDWFGRHVCNIENHHFVDMVDSEVGRISAGTWSIPANSLSVQLRLCREWQTEESNPDLNRALPGCRYSENQGAALVVKFPNEDDMYKLLFYTSSNQLRFRGMIADELAVLDDDGAIHIATFSSIRNGHDAWLILKAQCFKAD